MYYFRDNRTKHHILYWFCRISCAFECMMVTYCQIVFDIIFRKFKGYFKKFTGIKELFDGGVQRCEG